MTKSELRIGAGCAEVDFPELMFPSDGIASVHDKPHARVMLFDSNVRMALAVFELVSIPDDLIERIKYVVSNITKSEADRVLIHVTHAITTPHAPREDEEKKKMYYRAVEKAVEDAAVAATLTLRPASLYAKKVNCDVNVNRDVETPFGWWTGINPDGFSDKEAVVIKAVDKEGDMIGALISYGVKPCAIDNAEKDTANRQMSSDITGYACSRLEEKLQVPVMICMSAAADQVPAKQAWYESLDSAGNIIKIDEGVKQGLRYVEELGTKLYESMYEGLKKAADEITVNEIRMKSEDLIVDRKENAERKPYRTISYNKVGECALESITIGMGDLCIAATKPEICAITGRELKDRSPYKYTILMTMTNGGMKYMPDKKSYDRITWEVSSSMLMPGTAEKYLEETITLLNRMKYGERIPVVTSVGEYRPDGERITKAIIEFDNPVNETLANGISVKNRNVVGRAVDGNRVILTLDESDKEAGVYRKLPPMGPKKGDKEHSGADKPKAHKGHPDIPSQHLYPTTLFIKVPGINEYVRSTRLSEPVIEDFKQGSYRDFTYNLFTPSNQEKGKKYPLVVFIPDAEPNGSNPKLALSQGIGGVIWASPGEQEKHACYVLAIEVPKRVYLTNDQYTVAREFEQIKELIDRIVNENNIDTKRIYATGQSQGCMAFCEMNIRYPDYFAASLLVSAHWDVERMMSIKNTKLIFGLSSGGPKEYPSFNAIVDGFERGGVKVGRVHLNYREGWTVNNQKVNKMLSEGVQMGYVIFDKETAFPDDGIERPIMAHHSRGWELVYQLESVRDWLFAQTL